MGVKLFLVDDHAIFLDGMRSILALNKKVDSVASFSDAQKVINALTNEVPDMLIADITLKGMSGIELARVVKKEYPSVKIILLTMHWEPNYILSANEAGIDGYLLKDADMEELFKAMDEILAGKKYYCPEAVDILSMSKDATIGLKLHLTPKEKEVLKLVAEGVITRDIANILGLSEKTVETHRKNMLLRTGSKNAMELVKRAREENLI